ncbi:hypothetical protein CPter291_2966 [Collimonas pratensis]|uniref:Uncharacterized protein n=1 Tax=Collimonas pratensis TaxID=279113 RepID=A0ABN4MF10_9BURK|nr:hypothetical protein CPter291_2966 [Collimonas pratensis]
MPFPFSHRSDTIHEPSSMSEFARACMGELVAAALNNNDFNSIPGWNRSALSD